MRALLLLCALAAVFAAPTAADDGTIITNLYVTALEGLLENNWTKWDAAVADDAQLSFIGWGGRDQCTPISKSNAFNGFQQNYNSSYVSVNRAMAARDMLIAHVTFSGYMNPVGANKAVFADGVFQQVSRAENGAKINKWVEISNYATQNAAQLHTTSELNEAWSTGDATAYQNRWATNVQLAFNYEGASTVPAVFNKTMFDGYSHALKLALPASQPLIARAAGGCNMLAVRAIMAQTKLNGQGPSAVQDSIMIITMEDAMPYRYTHVNQILTPPAVKVGAARHAPIFIQRRA